MSAPPPPAPPVTTSFGESEVKIPPVATSGGGLGGLAEQLSRTRLKKVNKKKVKKEVLPQLCNDSKQYQQLMEDTYMEQYFDLISDFSFQSTFKPLSVETAATLVAAHEEYLQDPSTSADFSDKPLLVALAQTIDQEKDREGWPFVFVRLSSRSPKDAALSSPNFDRIYDDELQRLAYEEKDLEPGRSSGTNRQLHALYRASTWALRTATGTAAVRLLIEANRTYGDMKEYAEGKITGDFNVVVREFRTFLPEMEFRGFIYQNKFTSLTQYNEFCCFPRLHELRHEIVSKITQDFQDMMRIIPQESYVVDFVLATAQETDDRKTMGDVNALKVWVVELNPLAEFAGTGLFSWTEDKAVLLGRAPFEFRYHHELPDVRQCVANMTPSWREKLGLTM